MNKFKVGDMVEFKSNPKMPESFAKIKGLIIQKRKLGCLVKLTNPLTRQEQDSFFFYDELKLVNSFKIRERLNVK